MRYCAERSKTVTLRARVFNAVAGGDYEADFMSSPVGLSEGAVTGRKSSVSMAAPEQLRRRDSVYLVVCGVLYSQKLEPGW